MGWVDKCQDSKGFTHDYFCDLNINANRVQEANDILVLHFNPLDFSDTIEGVKKCLIRVQIKSQQKKAGEMAPPLKARFTSKHLRTRIKRFQIHLGPSVDLPNPLK